MPSSQCHPTRSSLTVPTAPAGGPDARTARDATLVAGVPSAIWTSGTGPPDFECCVSLPFWRPESESGPGRRSPLLKRTRLTLNAATQGELTVTAAAASAACCGRPSCASAKARDFRHRAGRVVDRRAGPNRPSCSSTGVETFALPRRDYRPQEQRWIESGSEAWLRTRVAIEGPGHRIRGHHRSPAVRRAAAPAATSRAVSRSWCGPNVIGPLQRHGRWPARARSKRGRCWPAR